MPTRGIPFPASKELFEFCRAILPRVVAKEHPSDADLGRVVGFENARTSRWKHGQIALTEADKLLGLSDTLHVDLRLLAQLSTGRMRSKEALALLEDEAAYARFIAQALTPALEGGSLTLTDGAGNSTVIERLGPRKIQRRLQGGVPTDSREPSLLPKRRVALLLDDDSKAGQLFLNAALDQPSVDALWITSATQALVQAGRLRPDLLLWDLYLPGTNGFAAIRSLRADPSTERSRIIATSAHLTPDIVERARGSGADDVLARPLQLRPLSLALRTLIGP